MTKTNRRYQLPTPSDLALKGGLSAKLKELWSSAQENSFELFLYAAALRERYLDKKTQEYSSEFRDWYKQQEIHHLFGKLPAFTKYAMAGNVVNFFANEFGDGEYVNQLPLSRSALYEISLLKDQISTTDLKTLLFSGGADGEALIYPSASASDISAYRYRQQTKGSKHPKSKSKKYNIPLATIYVSRDLYSFQKGTGQHVGAVKLQDAEKLLAAITSKLNPDMFDVRNNLAKISTTYQKKEDAASPSAALRKPKAKKPAKKKPKRS